MSPRKRFLTYLPYLLMGLYATNFGEAWRMACLLYTSRCV